MRQKLTQKKLAELPPGWHQDTDCPSLWVRVGARGSVWYARKSHRYKSITEKIGAVSAITREKALAVCITFLAALESGAAENMIRPAEVTFGDLHAAYIADRQSRGKRPADHCGHLDSLMDRRADEITGTEIRRIFDAITSAGKLVMANRVIACARAVFNYGKRSGLFRGENPAALPAVNAEKPRRVILFPSDASALLRALRAFRSDPLRKDGAEILLLCALTWQRIGNVTGMRWQDLDLDRGIWHISASDAKGRREIDCPLPPEAVQIITSRKSDPVVKTYVFERNGKKMGPPRKVWKSAIKSANLETLNLHRHDLRHIMASLALRAGVPLVTVSDQLAHRDVSFTARTYAHVMVDSKREALAAVTAALSSSCSENPNS